MAPQGIENNMKALCGNSHGCEISVDKPEKTRVEMAQEAGYTFTFLSDPKLEVIRRYDLVYPEELASGKDIAHPAEFLIDPSATIRWRMVTKNFSVRARAEDVLEAAKALP